MAELVPTRSTADIAAEYDTLYADEPAEAPNYGFEKNLALARAGLALMQPTPGGTMAPSIARAGDTFIQDLASIRGKEREAKAVGILQFWPWAEKYIDRENPLESADFWMKRIKRQLKKSVKKNCSFKSEKRKWLAAWVTAVRSPKKGGRCYEKVKHYGLLKRWHRSIKKLRKKIKDSDHYGCGC